MTFVNLNSKNILNIFKGKTKLSKFLCSSSKALFILGEGIKSCGVNVPSFISFIKIFFTSAQIIYLNKYCNSESLSLLNFKNFTKKDLKNVKNALFIDLDDKLITRKVVQYLDKPFI
jgi:hypothetical protein